MDVVFLDANVLFSAAYRPESGLGGLRELDGVALVTSGYAAEEARRNLQESEARARLDELLNQLRIVGEATAVPLPDHLALPEKDRPILRAAVAAGATHLLTGDVTHFGPLYSSSVSGVRIQPPAAFLRERRP